VPLTKYYSGDQNKKNEMGVYVARMGRGQVYTGFWCGSLWTRDDFEDLGQGRTIILKWIFKKRDGDID
jgi:hypothetical protein